jgi:DNA-binding transcriptional LysR family regulator
MHSGVLPTALRELRGDRPAVHIALYNQQSDVQLEGLRQRSLDIALVCEPPAFDDPDLEATQVLNDPMLLALPADHPLASAETITPEDLASQQWIGVMHRETHCATTPSSPPVRKPASPRPSPWKRPSHWPRLAWLPPGWA